MIGSTTAPIVANLTYEGNYCNGGNYSIGVRDDLSRIEDFASRTTSSATTTGSGSSPAPTQPGLSWERDTNLWADTLESVLG